MIIKRIIELFKFFFVRKESLKEPRCKICGLIGDIDKNRRCIFHRFDSNARRLW